MSDSAEQESTPTSGIQTKINPPVFYGSLIIIMGLVLFSVIAPETAGNFFNNLKLAVLEEASWFYVLTVAIIISLVAFLGISRYGEIKLGPDHSEPDYSYSSWFAMLFSAGMGIGLMFFGVAEPIMHFTSPPMAEPNSIAAANPFNVRCMGISPVTERPADGRSIDNHPGCRCTLCPTRRE